MPVTPFHYPLTYLIYRIAKNRFSLPALIVGGMIPDLEISFLLFLSQGKIDRLVLHSLFGAALIGLPLSIVFLITIYRRWLPPIFGVEEKSLNKETALSMRLVLSSLIGLESHVLIDLLHHPYNPLFFPFTFSSFNYVILGNAALASVIIPGFFGASLLFLLIHNMRLGGKEFWDRLLVK